ncbi:MAG: hypothetical protein Edafosvirus41_1, partial [Edafosvirus sp.]
FIITLSAMDPIDQLRIFNMLRKKESARRHVIVVHHPDEDDPRHRFGSALRGHANTHFGPASMDDHERELMLRYQMEFGRDPQISTTASVSAERPAKPPAKAEMKFKITPEGEIKKSFHTCIECGLYEKMKLADLCFLCWEKLTTDPNKCRVSGCEAKKISEIGFCENCHGTWCYDCASKINMNTLLYSCCSDCRNICPECCSRCI